ncbi:MAG: hypothetical protein ABIP93_04895 [Gemmatimonadaceae bacterium]
MNTGKSQIRRDPVRSAALTVAALGGIALSYACAGAAGSTGPDASSAALSPGDRALEIGPHSRVTPGVVTLCKVGADGAFNVQVGTQGTPAPLTLHGGTCQTIASVPPTQRDDVIVTVTETVGQSYALEHVLVRQGEAADRTVMAQKTVSLEAVHGAIVTYYNNAVVTVCEQGANATFEYQVGLNHPVEQLSLAHGQCHPIATIPHTQADDVIVHVQAHPVAAHELDHMLLTHGLREGETIKGHSDVSFEGVHGAVLTFYHHAVEGTSNAVDGDHEATNDHPDTKSCTANKSQKDPKVHDQNHDCRSDQGTKSDPKASGKK